MSGYTINEYDSLASLYLGATISMALWGIATLQVYHYYNRYTKDALWIKFLVFSVWALDTAQQALILETGYQALVLIGSSSQFIKNSAQSAVDSAVPGFLVTEIVHIFLVLRIWLLSKKNKKLAMIFAVLITLETVVSILDLTQTLPLKYNNADLKPYAWIVTLYFSTTAATDTLIALTLIVLLHRSRTGFKKSDNIINRLIVFSVNTGAIPSVLSLIVVVMVKIYPDNLLFLSFYFMIGKVYTNTLLATLNTREYDVEIQYATAFDKLPGTKKIINSDMSITIQVDTTTMHRTDDISLNGLKPEAPSLKVNAEDLV